MSSADQDVVAKDVEGRPAKRCRVLQREDAPDGVDARAASSSADVSGVAGQRAPSGPLVNAVAAYVFNEFGGLQRLLRQCPSAFTSSDATFVLDRLRSILRGADAVKRSLASSQQRKENCRGVPELPLELWAKIFAFLLPRREPWAHWIPLQARTNEYAYSLQLPDPGTKALVTLSHTSKGLCRALAFPLALRAVRVRLIESLVVRLSTHAVPLELDTEHGLLALFRLRGEKPEEASLFLKWEFPATFPASGTPLLTYISGDVFEVREVAGDDGPRTTYVPESLTIAPRRRLDLRATPVPNPWRAAGYLANVSVHYRAAWTKYLEAKCMTHSRALWQQA